MTIRDESTIRDGPCVPSTAREHIRPLSFKDRHGSCTVVSCATVNVSWAMRLRLRTC
ncbi:hypothetical protein DPMN_033892 [Dreissena polymorpha]|uniref:Uncharacterized protein n=1 Tax=Dreissena polymorpha TaxID=45954 RepID=A0A9D4M958_DREPO|nr:hypothetical protein DPMN_033892 [Dreissena polymorpha]